MSKKEMAEMLASSPYWGGSRSVSVIVKKYSLAELSVMLTATEVAEESHLGVLYGN